MWKGDSQDLTVTERVTIGGTSSGQRYGQRVDASDFSSCGASGDGETEYGRLRAEACTVPPSVPYQRLRDDSGPRKCWDGGGD